MGQNWKYQPLTREQEGLAKRLSVKEDDRTHIFGFTSLSGAKYLIATERAI
jgi:hypothetical protein